MIFKSERVAAQWDTWCYYHNGTYYLYYLITEHSHGEGFGVASSSDGVHWTDHGWALRASDRMLHFLGTGAVWMSSDFDEGGRFICNYSEWRPGRDGGRTQNIFFAWSEDLVHWHEYGDECAFTIDERFYEKRGRWDCIFPMPRPQGGYYGTWTATPKGRDGLEGGIGLGYSEDGLHWEAAEPAVVIPDADESGAFWQFGDKVHAMFGKGGEGMVAYSAERVAGPYLMAAKNPVLLRCGHTYFCRFLPTPNGVLVNHHAMSGQKHGDRPITYAAPLKRAHVDPEGILRLKYWEGNDALKGEPLATDRTRSTASVRPIADRLDFARGVVVEGSVPIPDHGQSAPVALALDAGDRCYAVRVQAEARVEMGLMCTSNNTFKCMHWAERDLVLRGQVPFRLLARRGMLEFYLADHLMECWTMGCPGARAVGLRLVGAWPADAARQVQVWHMSLPGEVGDPSC